MEKRYGRKEGVYTKKKSFQRVMHKEGKEKSGETRGRNRKHQDRSPGVEASKQRKERKKVPNEDIRMEEWENYFSLLLEGGKEELGEPNVRRSPSTDQESELEDEEIEKEIRKLKRNKAAGKDGIGNEAWLFSDGQIRAKLKEVLKRVWRGKGFVEEWREGLIVPLHKKGDVGRVENYRGVILLNTAYKIYAGILNERLKKDVEEKGVIQETQAGFRRGRGTMDNVYVLQHVVKKEVQKKGRIFEFFMDLKAAFDKVDRKELWKAMEEKGIRTGLVERIREIYASTKNAVRVKGKVSGCFWTEKEVRQGCPLSPSLFSILIADVQEEMKKGRIGGVQIGKGRI